MHKVSKVHWRSVIAKLTCFHIFIVNYVKLLKDIPSKKEFLWCWRNQEWIWSAFYVFSSILKTCPWFLKTFCINYSSSIGQLLLLNSVLYVFYILNTLKEVTNWMKKKAWYFILNWSTSTKLVLVNAKFLVKRCPLLRSTLWVI